MNVLVACEESQEVCKAFRNKGHNAFSCDILEPSGNLPQYHILGDVLQYINGYCEFKTMNGDIHKIFGPWDLIIAHPPCTYLCSSGERWFDENKYGEKARQRKIKRLEGFEFFMKFVNCNCDKIAIENPIGYVNTHYRKPDQIIQPYYFGHNARKSTCLWLKNLPKLVPTAIVDPGIIINGMSVGASAYCAFDENGKSLRWNDERTARIRSKTYTGIAMAMAEQWGKE